MCEVIVTGGVVNLEQEGNVLDLDSCRGTIETQTFNLQTQSGCYCGVCSSSCVYSRIVKPSALLV